MSLTAPQLGEQLDRLRRPVLESKRREFPRLPLEDLQDIYGQAVEGVLRSHMEFDGEAQLAAYLHRAVGNLARNVTRSGAQRTVPLSDDLGELPLADRSLPDPEDLVLSGQARTVLWEFLAELPSEQDRTIAYLHHDPAHALAPRQIARELDLPYQDVCSILKRTTVKLSRFAAQLARPGAFCHRRRGDVIEWQRTGIVPLPLRIHSHCHHCRAQHHDATVAARRAILPLLPVSGAPLAGVSLFSRVHQAVAAHPLTQRADGALGRWRKVAPVGGGGGAAIAGKLAAAGAIVTVGAATAALHAVTLSHPPSHVHHRRAVAHAAIRGASVRAGAAAATPLRYASPVATTTTPRTVTTSTVASSTTTTTTPVMPPAPNASSSLVRREEQTGNAPPPPNGSTRQSTETKSASSSNPSSSAANSSAADSRSTSAISGPPAPGVPPPP